MNLLSVAYRHLLLSNSVCLLGTNQRGKQCPSQLWGPVSVTILDLHVLVTSVGWPICKRHRTSSCCLKQYGEPALQKLPQTQQQSAFCQPASPSAVPALQGTLCSSQLHVGVWNFYRNLLLSKRQNFPLFPVENMFTNKTNTVEEQCF